MSLEKTTPNEAYFVRMLANKLKHDYMKRVAETSEQSLESVNIGVLDEQKNEWDTKEYKKQRITSEQYANLEKLRGQYDKEMDLEKKAEALTTFYKYLAYIYLKMPEEDFNHTDWQEIKLYLDSILFKLIFGSPNVMGNSNKVIQQQQQQRPRLIPNRNAR